MQSRLSFKNGFTLIEIIVAIAILTILFSVSILYYSTSSESAKLSTASQDIISNIKLAKDRTVASLASSSYGMHFENSQYVMFRGTSYSALDPNNIFYALPVGMEIANISLEGGGVDIIFDRITGKVGNNGSIDVRVASDISKSKTISIPVSGEAAVVSQVLSPTGTRMADSRHIHFTYSQDATNTTNLVLDFPGYTTSNIAFQDYLNAGKTVFDWSGTISVGGENQTLRILTHSLNTSVADFSITRDLRYNTKALNISLDGQNLVNYDASGNVTQGSSVNVSAPQIQ